MNVPTTPKPGDDERVLRVSREMEHGRDEIIRGEYVERQEAAGRSFITMVSEDEIQLLRDTRAALTLPAPEAAQVSWDDTHRIAAISEADQYMAEHRVTESWRVIRRLRDELVRYTSAALPVEEGNDRG